MATPSTRAVSLLLALAAALAAQEPQGPPPGGPGFGPGGPGGPMTASIAVKARFDADKDGVLDAAERAAARAWLKDNRPQRGGPGGPGGPGGRGGRGGPPGGFGPDGQPKEWPMRYSVAFWSVKLDGLKPGKYELRVRSVDKNGFAQPEPRDGKRSGKNQVPVKPIAVE